MAFNPSTFFSGLSTIADLVSSFAAVDTVGIFNQETLEQVFFNARPLKAEVKETSQVMSHPVETGTMLSDNHIINPIDINIQLMIKSEYYNSVYSQIKKAFINADKLVVQTRTSVYSNMIIANMPHQESPEEYDAVVMILHLKEVLFITPTTTSPDGTPANFSPENPTDANTVKAGLKYATPISTGNATAVQSILTAAGVKILMGK